MEEDESFNPYVGAYNKLICRWGEAVGIQKDVSIHFENFLSSLPPFPQHVMERSPSTEYRELLQPEDFKTDLGKEHRIMITSKNSYNVRCLAIKIIDKVYVFELSDEILVDKQLRPRYRDLSQCSMISLEFENSPEILGRLLNALIDEYRIIKAV